MNYLAQGIQQGFDTGSRLVEAKRKRKQEDDLARAERELRIDQQARELENRRVLQDAEQTFRGTQSAEERAARSIESEKDRTFRGGESEKDRGFRRGERIDSQGYQSGESALDRAARLMAQDRDLAQRDKQLQQQKDFHDVELPLAGARLGLQARAQDWTESQQNPLNRFRDAAALGKMDGLDDTNMFTINGGAPSPLTSGMRAPQTNAPRPQMAGAQAVTPPPAAVQMLQKNPQLAAEFDRKYGTGAAAKYLQGTQR